MKRNKIFCLVLSVALSNIVVSVSRYTFQLNFVEKITEEKTWNKESSRVCNLLVRTKNISRVCKNVVQILGRGHIGYLSNQPVENVTISIPIYTGGDSQKITKPTCKCPTDFPIYLTDGKSANSIMVITREREMLSKTKGESPRTTSDMEKYMKYIRYIRIMKKLKGTKHKHTIDFKFEPQSEDENSFLSNLVNPENIGAAIDTGSMNSGFLSGVGDFLGGVGDFFDNLDF